MAKICFSKNDFYKYLILLSIVVVFGAYVLFKTYSEKREDISNVNLMSHLGNDQLRKKLVNSEESLYNCELQKQRCQSDLSEARQMLRQGGAKQNALLNIMYNPLIGPERTYPGGRLNASSYDDYQQIGFIFKDNERYPLFGRYKYPGRSDRWEYYVMDETRNRLKIPFASRNDTELYEGDTVSIGGLGTDYSVKIYDYQSFRYNPNL